MTVLDWVHNALDWASVVTPLLFLVVYSALHRWWLNTYARCLAVLAFGLICGRLRDAMIMLDGTRDERRVILNAPLRLPWLHVAAYIAQTVALGVAAAVFGVLAWKLVRPHLPWTRPKSTYLDRLLAEGATRQHRSSR